MEFTLYLFISFFMCEFGFEKKIQKIGKIRACLKKKKTPGNGPIYGRKSTVCVCVCSVFQMNKLADKTNSH